MCRTTKTAAGKSLGSPAATAIKLSIPPLEAPMTIISCPGMKIPLLNYCLMSALQQGVFVFFSLRDKSRKLSEKLTQRAKGLTAASGARSREGFRNLTFDLRSGGQSAVNG